MKSYINNLLFILQNEHYEVVRFLSLVYRLHIKLFRKTSQKPDWTVKGYIGMILSIILFIWSIALLHSYGSAGRTSLIAICISILLYPIYFAISFYVLHAITTLYYRSKARTARTILRDTIVIGVIGSYGKTTMKHILAELFLSQGLSCSYTPGTINTLEGIIQRVCNVFHKHPTKYCIIEMGEHYIGDIDAICKVVPVDYAIITGATYQHYERFGSEKAIVQTLLEVVDHIKESGIILYNADSELFAAHYKSICPTFNRFAPYSKTDCQNIIGLPELAGTEFTYQGEKYYTKLLGSHIPSVICAGLKLLTHLGIKYDAHQAIADISYIEHRMQVRYNSHTDITILDDAYNANLEGYKSMISMLKSLERKGPIIYITPGILEGGRMSDALHAEIAKELLHLPLSLLCLIQTSSTKELKSHLHKLQYTMPIKEFLRMHDALAIIPHYAGEHALFVIQNDWPELYSHL